MNNYSTSYKTINDPIPKNFKDFRRSSREREIFGTSYTLKRPTQNPLELGKVFFSNQKKQVLRIKKNYFPFPPDLNDFFEILESAKELLTLEDNWDDEGASKPDTSSFYNLCDFSHKYSTYILKKYGAVIEKPYIDVLNDGSFYMQWENSKGKFLIIFKINNNISYFYGEDKTTGIPFKSGHVNGSGVEDHIAPWMKKILV